MMDIDQAAIDQFNQSHPLRSFIKFRDEKGDIEEAEVRAEAEFSRSSDPGVKGVPCIWVKGRYDAVHLKDVIQ